MAKIQFSNGVEIDFDGEPTQQDIEEASKKAMELVPDKFQAPKNEQPQPQQGLGLWGKIKERGKNIINEFKPGQEKTAYQNISDAMGGKVIRTAGNVIGAAGDVLGAGVEAGAKTAYNLLPDKGKEVVQNKFHEIVQNPLVSEGITALQEGADKYEEFSKANPNASKDINALANILSAIPIGKGAGFAKEVVEGATTETRKTIAKGIVGSAEKNISQALAPTTKEAKTLTAKIAPEIIKQGISGSRESILKKSEEMIESFGKKIENYISSGQLKGEVPKAKISSVIDKFEKSGMTGSGVVLDTEKVKLAEQMRGIISKFGDNLPAEEAKSALRILGEMTARKKGFTTGGEKLSAQLEKDIYGSIAGELAKANPDLDKLNKTFSFYKNLAKITSETIERTKPQSGNFRRAAAVLFAGKGEGVLDTAVKYVGSKVFLDFVSGSFYKTMSAKAKNALAKAIYSGDTKAANTLINAVKSDAGRTVGEFIEKTKNIRPGMTIEDVSRKNPLIQEARKYKSAEEFVKAQTNSYHGTAKSFDVFDAKKRTIQQGESSKAGFHFANDPEEAKVFAREAAFIQKTGTSGEVMPVKLQYKNPKYLPEGQSTAKIERIELAKKEGYDAVIDDRGNVVVFSPEQIKTKSQLTDIWNQANKSQPLQEGVTASEKRSASIKAQKEAITKQQVAEFQKEIDRGPSAQYEKAKKAKEARRQEVIGIARSYPYFNDFAKRFPKEKEATLKKIFLLSRKANR